MEAQATIKNNYVTRLTLRKLLRVVTALGALALLVLILVKLYNIYQLSTEKIYKESYVPYKLSIANITDTTTFTTIELYYAEKDYDEVVRQSKNLMSVLDRERLLIGIAYLQKDEYLKAISWLNRLAEVKQNPYQQDAQFYLTLTHLKNKDYDRTIELMQSILDDPEHVYHNRFTPQMIKEIGLLKWK